MIKDCVWGDYFCQDCFNATHATGKRRGHITEDIEQLVCAVCDREPATSMCVQDGLFLSLIRTLRQDEFFVLTI